MGGGVGEYSVLEYGFRPKLFVGVGVPAELGKDPPPLLLLGGQFEELFPPAQLRARTDAEVVISPWSDHILEMYDPVLVRAAVKAACAAVDNPVPAAPTAWQWRIAGLVLGIAGALVLMVRLPELHPGLARMRRFIVPTLVIITAILTMGTWLGVTPQWRRIPQQLVLLPLIWLALAGLRRLRLPRWSLPVLTGIMALGFFAFELVHAGDNAMLWRVVWITSILVISTLLLLPSTLVGRIGARGGSRRDGDVAMAIMASYAIGQYMPMFY